MLLLIIIGGMGGMTGMTGNCANVTPGDKIRAFGIGGIGGSCALIMPSMSSRIRQARLLGVFIFQGLECFSFVRGIYDCLEYTMLPAMHKPKPTVRCVMVPLIDGVFRFDMADFRHIEPRPPSSTQFETASAVHATQPRTA